VETGRYKVNRVKRIERAVGSTFVGKGDALLVIRETDSGYELEVIELKGLKSVARAPVGGVVAVTRVGEDAVLLKTLPERGQTANENERKMEVRSLKDFHVRASFVEDKPGYVAAHPDGTRIAMTHDFGPLQVWDTVSGGMLSKYVSEGTGGVAYSHDGSLLAVKEFAGALKIFDAESPLQPLRSVVVGGEAQITFHPQKPVVAAADRNTIQIVDASTANVTAFVKLTEKESQGAIGHMAYSPDGMLLATTILNEGVVSFWDMATGEFAGHLLNLDMPLSGLEFDAQGALLLVASYEAAELYTIVPSTRV